MTTVDAHAMFQSVPDDRRPDGLPPIEGIDPALLFAPMMTAAVRLSGRLEQCQSGAELERAIVEFHRGMKAGEINLEQWQHEGLQVMAEVVQWCEAIDATRLSN